MSEPKWEALKTWVQASAKDDYPEGSRCLSFTRLIDEIKEIEARLAPAPAQAREDEAKLVFLILYDDRDRGVEVITDETAARERYHQISQSWNAHLFVKIESNSRDDEHYSWNAALRSRQSSPVSTLGLTPIEVQAMMNAFEFIDPAMIPGISIHTRANLGRFAKPSAASQPSPQGEDDEDDVLELGEPDKIDPMDNPAWMRAEIARLVADARLLSQENDDLRARLASLDAAKEDGEMRIALEDRHERISSICGYLMMWRDHKERPSELNELIEEIKDWLVKDAEARAALERNTEEEGNEDN